MNDYKITLAPMEGVTDSLYRNTFAAHFKGVCRFYTPFLSPAGTHSFQTKELRNIDPEKNDPKITVPQILVRNPEDFLWAAGEIAARGFKEVNLNLGCPSGTVTAKRKGSGFLMEKEELRRFFETVCPKTESLGLSFSVKTRIGYTDPEEFPEILSIYNDFPLCELIIHPRVKEDLYKKPVRPEWFEYAANHTSIPLQYNGDIKTVADIEAIYEKYPALSGVMIGRALIGNPFLAEEALCLSDSRPRLGRAKAFHDDMLEGYSEYLCGDQQILARMKELWFYLGPGLGMEEKAVKKMLKAKSLSEYKAAAASLWRK